MLCFIWLQQCYVSANAAHMTELETRKECDFPCGCHLDSLAMFVALLPSKQYKNAVSSGVTLKIMESIYDWNYTHSWCICNNSVSSQALLEVQVCL
ncbi:uncharacterized protein BKA55DRAFT_556516 [Fusarium redolens]|uniref:Secreted protein n=1 Tax=Fusarium redolens TaxID=48865 RepID=A0A9P9R6G8_FUSRE|nr:uncharacterized protein BKA55DRAFT_556516 [Fusarium redolens]KAH7267742.1 hypothetical protein BKA55DRAFT_556516 [Fusarium redolens]